MKNTLLTLACLCVLPAQTLFGSDNGNAKTAAALTAATTAPAPAASAPPPPLTTPTPSSSSASAQNDSNAKTAAAVAAVMGSTSSTKPLVAPTERPGIFSRAWSAIVGGPDIVQQIKDKTFTGLTTHDQHQLDWTITDATDNNNTTALETIFTGVRDQKIPIAGHTGINPALVYTEQQIAQHAAALRVAVDTQKAHLKRLKILRTMIQGINNSQHRIEKPEDQSDDEHYDHDAYVINKSNAEKATKAKAHILSHRLAAAKATQAAKTAVIKPASTTTASSAPTAAPTSDASAKSAAAIIVQANGSSHSSSSSNPSTVTSPAPTTVAVATAASATSAPAATAPKKNGTSGAGVTGSTTDQS